MLFQSLNIHNAETKGAQHTSMVKSMDKGDDGCSSWSIHSIAHYSCFSDFVFKIRLMRLGFSFQNTKNSQPPDSQSGVITTTPTEPTVSGRHRKAFSNLQSCLTDSS